MKFKQSLLLISIFLISLLAISAVSAEDADAAVISDVDDVADVLAVDEADDQVSIDEVEKEDVVKEEAIVDSNELAVPAESEDLSISFGSGNGTKFDFSNITFSTGNGTTFDIGSLLNGTFTLGNGSTFNFSSLGNGTISFGNGTSFDISSLLNSTGNGTSFDISGILDMFGGTKLTATTSDMEQVYSGKTTFSATILQSNKTVEAGKDVIFTIGNKDYLGRTDANGTATVDLDLKAGEYYIFTEYNNEILAKNKIVIKKAASKIAASAKSYKAKTKIKKYTITLKNNKGKAIKNAKVTLKVNGKTYSATTNANGKATFKITKLTKKGKNTAIIKYAGNGYYKSSSVSKKITVK